MRSKAASLKFISFGCTASVLCPSDTFKPETFPDCGGEQEGRGCPISARNTGMTVLLKPLNGGRPIVLDKPILLVGRHPDCDVIIKDSQKISRKHCCLALVDNRFVVRDLESMNGVFVNGKRVVHSADVKIGGELMIGDVRFQLLHTNSERARSEKPMENRDRPKIRDESGQTADVSLMRGSDKVEFSSAFAMPIGDNSQNDEFIPLADVDD